MSTELSENTSPEPDGTDCTWSQGPITVERIATAKLPTKRGNFKIAGYRSLNSDEEFVVLYKGEMNGDVPTFIPSV
jgi:hypothetical protein